MKAVVYLGPAEIALQDLPAPSGTGALIDIEACGICGTDLAIAKGAHPRAQPGLILGHEFIGRLAEPAGDLPAGTRVTAFPLISCGRCQACRTGLAHICAQLKLYGIDAPGGMAAQVRIPAELLLPVPADLPLTVAAQIEPLAVCIRAARQAGLYPAAAEIAAQSALILGAGPIGVTQGLVLRHLGLQSITFAELNPARSAAAAALGFDTIAPDEAALRAALNQAGRDGYDLVFDCAGVPISAQLALALVRSAGTVVMVAVHKTPVAIDLRDLNFREVLLIGTRVYTRADFAAALQLLPGLGPDLARLVTRLAPFEDAPQVFHDLAHGAPDLKVILHP